MGLYGLLLGNSDRGERRLAEHGRGDVLVIRLFRVALHRLSEGHAFHQRNRSQLYPIYHVTQRPDARARRLEYVVHLDCLVRTQLHVHILQSEILYVWLASGGKHALVALDDDVPALRGADGHAKPPALSLLDGDGARVHVHLHPSLLEVAQHKLPALLVEPAKREVSPADDVDLGPEPGVNAGELDGDVAASNDAHDLGRLLVNQTLVRRVAKLLSRDIRHEGSAPRRDENVFRLQDRLGSVRGGHLDAVGVHDFTPPLDVVAPRVLQKSSVDSIQPLDFRSLLVHQVFEVEATFALLPPETARVSELRLEARGVDEQLLRHAPSENARSSCAAHVLAAHESERKLHDGDLETSLCNHA